MTLARTQNRVGSKFGGGGVARADEAAIDRRERLRKLALETIDLAKVRRASPSPVVPLPPCGPSRPADPNPSRPRSSQDPYILRNHLGGLECRLCLTLHTNEGSYLAHTQGKKHQTNLARRAARDAHDPAAYAQQLAAQSAKPQVQTKSFIKIGVPGYQVRFLFARSLCRAAVRSVSTRVYLELTLPRS